MNRWWKKALAVTLLWAVLVISVGTLLGNNASSQYAADKITVWIAPVLALGTCVVWITSFATKKRR